MSKKILIAEDEQSIRHIVKDYLIKEDYEVLEASNGQAALEILNKEKVDLIVLDVMMPIIDGFTVCREIRQKEKTPIIFLTAKTSEADEVQGLGLKANDYVKKPFSPAVLMMRIKNLLEQEDTIHTQELTFGDLSINAETMKCIIEEEEVDLTAKEFKLLYYLASRAQIVLSREQILEEIWGYDFEGDVRVVDTHIKKVRKALGEHAYMIRTIFGAGYKFEG